MNGDPALLLRLLAAQLLLQLALLLLARALGRRLRPEVVAAGLLLPALLLLPWLSGPQILLPTTILAGQIPGTAAQPMDPHSILNDIPFLLMPWELEVRRAFAAGRLPLWSDLLDGGSSPWANPQASVLSPTALGARLLPPEHHLLAFLALDMLVALQGAWLAGRALGARRLAALLAAAGYALGGGILAWGLFPHSAVAAWAPWCLAACVRLARRSTPVVLAGCAITFACLLLAGQPEVAFGAGALAAVAAWSLGRHGRRWRGGLRVVLAGVLGFALAAPVVLPFLALVPESLRTRDVRRRLEQADAKPTPGRLRPRFQQPRMLAAPLSPLSFGTPYDRSRRDRESVLAYSVYPGLLAVGGLAAAVASRRSRRRAALPLAVFGFVLVLVAGFRPLGWIWVHLPGVGLQAPSRLLPIAALCAALAAAVGLDHVLRARRTGGAAIALVIAAAGSLAVARSAGIAATWMLILAAAALAPRRRGLAVAVLGLALLGDQIAWGRRLLPAGEPRLFYPRTPEVEAIVELAGGEGARAVGHRVMLHPAILSVYGLSDPRPHNPLASVRYLETLEAAFGFAPGLRSYFGLLDRPEHPFLDFLGVRVVVSNIYLPRVRGMRVRRLGNPILKVYLNSRPLPRFFLPGAVDLVSREEVAGWIRGMEDPRRVALLSEELAQADLGAGFRAGRVRVERSGPGDYSLRVPPQGRKLIASSIRGPEGWQARADGARLRTVTVNGAFLGVLVPPGVREFELAYLPPGLLAGVGLAGLAAVGFVGALVHERWRRRRARREGDGGGGPVADRSGNA